MMRLPQARQYRRSSRECQSRKWSSRRSASSFSTSDNLTELTVIPVVILPDLLAAANQPGTRLNYRENPYPNGDHRNTEKPAITRIDANVFHALPAAFSSGSSRPFA